MADQSRLCVDCGKEILDGSMTATGPSGEMHYRCFKVGTAHGREVKMVRCANCGAMKVPGPMSCFQCGVGDRIG